MKRIAAAALTALTVVGLSACTFSLEIGLGEEPSAAPEFTPPDWCPEVEDLNAVAGEYGQWQYIGGEETYDCRFVVTEGDDPFVSVWDSDMRLRLVVMEQDDDWWPTVLSGEDISVVSYRTKTISDELILAWPGPDYDAQTMCDLLVPGEYWSFELTDTPGACDALLDIHKSLEKKS